MRHEKFNPIAAWSHLACCCGGIWFIITYFGFCSAVNKATARDTCKAWTQFIPIYGGLELSKVIGEVNGLIEHHGVDTDPVADVAIINILFMPYPFYTLLVAWGAIADKLNSSNS